MIFHAEVFIYVKKTNQSMSIVHKFIHKITNKIYNSGTRVNLTL